MAKTVFHCKQFSLHQDQCAMKVNTDGLLLGAWAPASILPCRILDVGTGTGLIALMMAQRFPKARITAIEIDPLAAQQAAINVATSPFADKVKVQAISLQDYLLFAAQPNSFDTIVSNPPFFTRSLKSPHPKRNLARHTDTLPLPFLLEAAQTLLKPHGQLALVLPISEATLLLNNAPQWHLHQLLYIQENEQKTPHRILLSLGKQTPPQTPQLNLLSIRDSQTQLHSAEYRQLTQDFHTIF